MSAPVPGSFGHLLRRYRLAAGRTQEQLAALSGLGVRTIVDLERGVTLFPHSYTVETLADALHLAGPGRVSFASAARRPGASAPQDQENAPTAGAPSFVGRASELAIGARFLAGEGPAVLLFAGEPGIGKSRLLRELMTQARTSGWRVVAGGCDQRSGREPYAPFVEALDESLRATPPSRRKGDLKECDWLARLGPELAEQIRTPVPEWSLTPGQEQRMIFAAARHYLTNIAGPAGILVILDDLQWAGLDALDLLTFLVRTRAIESPAASSPQAALRVLGAYRTSEVQSGHPLENVIVDLAHDDRVTLCELDRLSEGEARSLATGLVGGGPGADQWVTEVVARAEGVPFYLVNYAQAINPGVEAVPLVSDGDFYSSAREVKTPWLVTATIRRRLSALPPEAQETLALAAIIGRVAPLELLRLALRSIGDDLAGALEAVCRARLLEEVSSTVVAYRFTHDLIRETVFASLSRARQELLHRIVADAIEQLSPPERARQVAALADHLAQAGEQARALPYAVQAGDQAEAAYAHTEAIAQYRAAVHYAEELGDLPRKAEALEKLGASLLRFGHTDPALAPLEEAAELYTRLNDTESRRRALAFLVQTHWQQGTANEYLETIRPILAEEEALENLRASPALAVLYNSVCGAHRHDGQHEERVRAAKQLERMARELQDDALLFAARQHQAHAALISGITDSGPTNFLNLAPLAEGIGDPVTLLELYNDIAAGYLSTGEFSLSLTYSKEALRQAQRTGAPHHITRMLINRAELHYYRGAWAETRADVLQADAIAEETTQFGVTYSSLYRPLMWGALEMAEGHQELARRLLDQVFERSCERHDLQAQAHSRQYLDESGLLDGRATEVHACVMPLLDRLRDVPEFANYLEPIAVWALLDIGRKQEAVDIVETCIATMRTRSRTLFLTQALRVRAMAAIDSRRWDEAKADLDEAIALAGAMPYPYAKLKALFVYGQLYAAMDEPLQVRTSLEQALAICDQLGEGLYRKHIERDLAALG